ncbi:hypothetical protein GIB67_005972 [Kingdonia uniflora]|uniref:NB-ARC domain-containing protein n=1 Tax=Kingdonia uniflora TaxID=39325 RepID=A0A7J7MC45_9MAGN|nr:hypothetical protein GIB67_005972 [Kingdonia uniflora]
MADAFISVVMDQLAPFLLDKLKEEVKLRHVKNVLLNLEKNEIKKVPESAWLEKLKDVSYEMEDVLDEWRTKILISEIAVNESSAPDGRTGKKKPFDLKRIAKAIIEAVGGGVPNLTEWEAWHNHLCQSLEEKLFLLVLDDVWTEDRASWDLLKLSLDRGKKGSRIVVTTRNDAVALTVSTTDKHNLQQLSDDGCWLLFEHLAFEGRRGESDCQRLKDIGRKISDRCKGVPLYAKTLESLMPRKRTVEDWEDVLASDIWKLPTVSKGVLPPLLLSYNALPSHLKRCFTYCAVFPKDHRIEKDCLIKVWMADGCLQSSQTRELESIGAEFFDELVMRSFFQNLEMDMDGNVSYYKIHDLIHDFAIFLANNECLVVESSEINFIHSKTRHLSVMFSAEDEGRISLSIWNLKSLRTLLVWRYFGFEDLTLLSH